MWKIEEMSWVIDLYTYRMNEIMNYQAPWPKSPVYKPQIVKKLSPWKSAKSYRPKEQEPVSEYATDLHDSGITNKSQFIRSFKSTQSKSILPRKIIKRPSTVIREPKNLTNLHKSASERAVRIKQHTPTEQQRGGWMSVPRLPNALWKSSRKPPSHIIPTSSFTSLTWV